MAPYLDGSLKGHVLEEALEAAWATKDERYRAWALRVLAPQLDRPLLQKALEEARAIVLRARWATEEEAATIQSLNKAMEKKFHRQKLK